MPQSVITYLVIGALQEGGVDATEGLEALHRHTGAESNSMLLRNTHVIGTLWEASPEQIHAGAPLRQFYDTYSSSIHTDEMLSINSTALVNPPQQFIPTRFLC